MPKVDDSLLVASGQGVLARGTLLGLVTATGKAKSYPSRLATAAKRFMQFLLKMLIRPMGMY